MVDNSAFTREIIRKIKTGCELPLPQTADLVMLGEDESSRFEDVGTIGGRQVAAVPKEWLKQNIVVPTVG